MKTGFLTSLGAGLAMVLGLVACGGGQEPSERTLAAGQTPSSQMPSATPAASNAAQGSAASASQDSASRSTDRTEPAKRGEPNPYIPTNLWQPPDGATPVNGSHVYLESDPNDEIGQGVTRLYTTANSVISARHGNRSGQGAFLGISVKGDQQWEGDFQVSQLLSQVQMGHYVRLKQYPRHDPVFGGLSWSSEGRRCKLSSGWVAVEHIFMSGNDVSQFELRFEQVCHDSQGRLRGKIRWSASDTWVFNHPANPVPSGLWHPPAGAMPATGNAMYIESDPRDAIAQGQRFLLTGDNTSTFQVASDLNGNLSLWVQARNSITPWIAYFRGMGVPTQLEPGLYPNLPDYINAFNAMYGGFDLGGMGTNCGTSNAWVAIDSVTYDGSRLTGLEMRFEQFCWNEGEGLRGALRWTAPTVN